MIVNKFELMSLPAPPAGFEPAHTAPEAAWLYRPDQRKRVSARGRGHPPCTVCARSAGGGGRSRRLKIAATWPWADAIITAWDRLAALPHPP
jgi:hypothetical protein